MSPEKSLSQIVRNEPAASDLAQSFEDLKKKKVVYIEDLDFLVPHGRSSIPSMHIEGRGIILPFRK
jgi:hypothetical protein